MTKAELVEKIAQKAGFTKADAERAVAAFVAAVTEGVEREK
jgi:nucleoid DNA-binding protein